MSVLPTRRGFRAPSLALAVALVGLCARAATAAGAGESSAEHGGVSLWPLLNFAMLLGVLFYFGRQPVQSFFRERRSKIQADLTAAAEKLREAEARHTKLQRQLEGLDEELERIRGIARSRAEQEREQLLADARAAAERVRADARAAIQQESQRAREALRGEAAQLALALAAERLRREIGESDRERLVDEFIARIESDGAAGVGSRR